MFLLESATMQISTDEPCLTLAELNRVSDVTHQWERFQEIRVVRKDKTEIFMHSIGPTAMYKADQFFLVDGTIEMNNGVEIIPRYGLPEHGIKKIRAFGTVASMLELADIRRDEPSWVNEFPNRVTTAAWLDQKENERKFLRGHSTFGPGGSTVRNL